jgi:hypothetical protein
MSKSFMFKFDITSACQRREFAKNGEIPKSTQVVEIEAETISPEGRAAIAPHLDLGSTPPVLDTGWVRLHKPDGPMNSTYTFMADTPLADFAFEVFINLLKAEPENIRAQEQRWMEEGGFENNPVSLNSIETPEIRGAYAAHLEEKKAETIRRSLDKKAELEAVPAEERKLIPSYYPPYPGVDFNAAGLADWAKAYNDAIWESRHAAVEAQWAGLKAWAEGSEASELLRLRVEQGYNWKELAMKEMITAAIGLEMGDMIDYSDWENVGNPDVPDMNLIAAIRKNLPEWATVDYCLATPEDEDDDETENVISIKASIGSTTKYFYVR